MEENKNINVKSNTQGNTQENVNASTAKKRRHSDSPPIQSKASTSSEKQVNLNRNETSSIKMAVAHKEHPDVLLTPEITKMIEDEIMKALDDEPADSESPQFESACFEQGALMMTCANEYTKKWLIQTINRRVKFLIVIDSENLLKKPRLRVRIPEILEEEQIKKRLSKQNPKLNIDMWDIIQRTSKKDNKNCKKDKETLIHCDVDRASFLYLQENNFEAYWRLGKITFHILSEKTTKNKERL